MGPTDGFSTVDDGRAGVGISGLAGVDGCADVASLVGWLDCAVVGCVACVGLVSSGWVGAGGVECLAAAPVEGAGSVGSADVHRAVD
ncbi:hypothetical protein [Kribbella sp. NPDC048928]|uniref:hypothetical protein n=1 Tax=Kribbella sp. NPDC048928 TaxID=3364111 RepID=UPI0037229482